MNEPSKAVFLSYASQDAEAAKRIADALRETGVEVWFDQSELRGGDAWDQNIRRQIKSCALFIPVVSANTQARREGYFRLEWKLADDRTHLMAKGTPFILPVCVDDTKDWDAIVPDSFMSVQWTRLAAGAGATAFAGRVAQLLRGENPAPASRRAPTAAADPTTPGPVRSGKKTWLVASVAAIAALGGVVAWRWTRGVDARTAQPAAAQTSTSPAAASQSEAQKLTRQALALLDDPMELRENFFLADELAQRAVKADPTDGEAWAVAGRVSMNLARRAFDVSPARLELARTQIGRARSLAPASIEGAFASALLQQRNGDVTAAEQLLLELTEKAPGDWRIWMELGRLRFIKESNAEAVAAYDKAAALAPNDARPPCRKANVLISDLRLAEADQLFTRALTLNPGREVYLRRFLFLGLYVYDVPAARAFLETVPVALRQEDGMISQVAEFYLRTGDGDRALAELRRLPRDFFEDGWDWRPKGYLAGYAHQIAGRPAAAQSEWKQALAVVEKRLVAEPRNESLLYWQCVLQALTGQVAAAREGRKVLNELSVESVRQDSGWFDAILLVALGDHEAAIDLMVKRWPTMGRVRMDLWGDFLYAPWFAPIRNDPRIRAMALEHKAAIDRAYKPEAGGAAAPEVKSVAVLAFDNRSDDKDAEYFSDGVSEELINALGRVPGLTVKGRTSAFFFKGRNETAQEIAEKLGVAYLVRGSVRKAGSQVRITVQLSRAATDQLIWSSEPLDRDLKDVFAVQDEIVALIAKNLSVQMGVATRAAHAVTPDALAALLEGRHFWVLRTPEGFARARTMFNRAVALDPEWAPAHAALANLEAIEASYVKGAGGAAAAQFQVAEQAAKRAIQLDPTLGEPYAALGKIAMEAGRAAEATDYFRRALALEPNNALVHDWYGDLCVGQGRLDVAIAEYRRALELEPLSPYILWDLAWELLHVRRFEESLALVDRAIALTPAGSPRLALRRARLLVELGRQAEAATALKSFLSTIATETDPQFANELVWALRATGSAAESERWAKEFVQHYPDSPASGVIWVMLGDLEKAYPLLEKTPMIFHQQIYWESIFDPLRGTPRFQQLLDKLGCADAYQVARDTRDRLLREYAAQK